MIKIKIHNILSIGMQTICMDGQCHKTCVEITVSGLKKYFSSMKISQKSKMKTVI